MRTQDVPLPEGDETDETTNKETEPALEYGWRVRWGRTIGQRQLASGVVLAFEPNTTKASQAFDRRAKEYLKDMDVRNASPGRGYVGDVRSGKYVEMDWISRPKP
ncbi:hypothetical protein PP631_gp057 [Streptomyces phage KimJongPhill]|uniref:Uncharacterized protein n=1 Tax=Streptomyces phage KimJongPhill TaxID=2848886 RepID=A0A8F2E6E3_9CAUD|nr:hypothetical protein PP631_gp057 [Streptomyces phage KimJongPhill]QWT29838.1 hypothetical protein SEA_KIMJONGPHILL_57 [Streptomyces phage KimJongPhill]